MLNRIVLAIIFLASLTWIAYVGIDLASEKNNYSPESLFNHNDGEVLVVVRPNEVNISGISAFIDAPGMDLIHSLNDSIYTRGYFSQRRAHMLLIKEDNWNESVIQQLFGQGNVKVTSSDEFKVGLYNGRFYKSNLYVWKPEVNNEGVNESERFVFDKKASAAIIRFAEDKSIANHSDIYFKENGTIDYITRDADIQQGTQVRDEQFFAGITTRNFTSYHFFERDFYATKDKAFTDGPMSKWLMHGFIQLDYNGEKVIISDYIGGQDPILIMNDLNQTTDTSRFSQPLTNSFPSSGKSYTIKYLEDAVVIAEKNETAEQVIADYKLGNTIALHPPARQRVFGNLPRAVSERLVSSESSYSKAVYGGRLLETHTGLPIVEPQVKVATSMTMSCGFDIRDFAVLPGDGNVIALSVHGKIKGFKNQKQAWEGALNGKSMGEIQLIDLHGSGEKFVLLNTKDEIHLWNVTGHYETGFPIKLETEAVNEVKFYRWKGKSYFLIANEDNKVVQFDAKGRELTMFNAEMQITRQIDVWASQRRLFAGFANANQFKMFDFEKKRIHREFPISTNAFPLKSPNQLFQYVIENDRLIKFDQKGIKFEFDRYNQGKLLDILMDNATPVLIVKSANKIHLINSEGISFGEISLPFNEIEDVHIHTDDYGKTCVAILDGLENNVYLYGTDGQQIVKKSLEGQSKIRVHSSNQMRITTIVDQFVIQYFEH